MKILVLGNIHSKWIKEYIEFVLLPLGHSVEVLGNEDKCKYADFYRSNNIIVHKVANAGPIIDKIPFIRTMSVAIRTVRANNWSEYDFIINLFVNYCDLMITARLRSKNTRTVMYFAGSELLRKSKLAVQLYNVLLPHADLYVVGSKTLLADFNRKFGKGFHGEVIHFGISAFDSIDNILNSGRIKKSGNTFCIGYSGVREHQHLEIISLFEKLPERLKTKAKIVVPMTYVAAPDYLQEVKDKLEQAGVHYHQYIEFMDNVQMAELWCSVDYFINAQTTDSLSASVLECVYAGCELINSSWLEYPEYQEMGIKKTNFKNFEELYSIITNILDGNFTPTNKSNRQLLYNEMSWDSLRMKWDALFHDLDNQN